MISNEKIVELLGKKVSVTLRNSHNFTGVLAGTMCNQFSLVFDRGGELGLECYGIENIIDIQLLPESEQALSDNNYQSKDIMVSHPNHYISETGLEVIDVIEAFTFDLKGIEATDTGNVIKYICRWKQKNGLQDLEKAMWYLQHLINHVEKIEKEND